MTERVTSFENEFITIKEVWEDSKFEILDTNGKAISTVDEECLPELVADFLKAKTVEDTIKVMSEWFSTDIKTFDTAKALFDYLYIDDDSCIQCKYLMGVVLDIITEEQAKEHVLENLDVNVVGKLYIYSN